MIDPSEIIEEIERRADLSNSRVIDVKFATYTTLVYGCLPSDLPKTQFYDVRNAFFAGMMLYQGDVLGLMGADDDLTPEAIATLERYTGRIMQELEEHGENVLGEMMQTEGSA